MDFDFLQILAAFEWWDNTIEWFANIFTTIGDFFQGLFAKIGEFIKGLGKWALWALVIILILLGFAGTFIPFLPGTTLILAGVYVHYFAMGRSESELSVVSLVIITILYVASIIVDNLSGAIGAKWFGSSKWGIVGAILGGIIGFFVGAGLPGVIIGPIIGVFIFEVILGKKKVRDAGSSTMGTVIGSGAGIIAGMGIGLLMIVCYVLDLLVFK